MFFTIWEVLAVWAILSALIFPFIISMRIVAGRADERMGLK